MKWLFHSYNETINFKKVHFRSCFTVDGSSLHLAASLGLVEHSHKMHLAFEVDLQGLVQNPHSSLGNTSLSLTRMAPVPVLAGRSLLS